MKNAKDIEIWGKISGFHGDGCEDNCRSDGPDNGGSKHLWNVRQFLPDYKVQHQRRQSSSNKNLSV
jgi:hypothetical protein